jgi:hypothetical protein
MHNPQSGAKRVEHFCSYYDRERRKKRPASRKQNYGQPHRHGTKQGYATQCEAEPKSTHGAQNRPRVRLHGSGRRVQYQGEGGNKHLPCGGGDVGGEPWPWGEARLQGGTEHEEAFLSAEGKRGEGGDQAGNGLFTESQRGTRDAPNSMGAERRRSRG